MENMKNPIIKKTTIPFRELKSLAVPYAGNCAPDAEKVDMVCVCDCACHCDCDCRCIEDNECHCDCSTAVCDCNCVCDCGALDTDGTLIIPEGIERIYPDTYRGQDKISRVILPQGLKAIGERAFEGCTSLCEVVFQEGLVEIEAFAFKGCRSLTVAELPDSLTTLGTCAFDGCYALEKVVFGKLFNGFDCHVFSACNALATVEVRAGNTHYKAIDNVLYSRCGRTLYFYPRGKRDISFVTPERVTKVAPYAIAANDYLKEIYLTEGVKTIGERGFQGCNELSAVSLPLSLEKIGNGAFGDCRSLVRVSYRGTTAAWQKVKCEGTIFSYMYDTHVVATDE